jgi:hypothetical protein
VNLRSDVERLQARLAGESASIEGLRQGVAAAAQQEAAALAGLQGQVRVVHEDTRNYPMQRLALFYAVQQCNMCL